MAEGGFVFGNKACSDRLPHHPCNVLPLWVRDRLPRFLLTARWFSHREKERTDDDIIKASKTTLQTRHRSACRRTTRQAGCSCRAPPGRRAASKASQGKQQQASLLARRRAATTVESTIADYLLDHEGGNSSLKTLQWHQTALGLLCHFLQDERGITLVGEVDAPDINAWFASMRKTPTSRGKVRTERTIQTYARSARAFFHWLVRCETIERNPFDRVRFPKMGKPLICTIEPEEFERLLVACTPPGEVGPMADRAPAVCKQCQHGLETVEVTREERAQVWDLPSLRLQVTEYRAQVKVCPCCQQETRAAFPQGLQPSAVQYGSRTRALAVYLQCMHLLPYARTCQILSDLLGTSFSQASLQAALQCASSQVEEALSCIKQGLISSLVMHNDESGLRIAGQRLWLHVASTPRLTYYQYHQKRGKEATDAMGILPQFHGISVHDSWASYLQYACLHALCHVHSLRELTFIHEQYKQHWAKALKDLLLEIKMQVELTRSQGHAVLPRAMRQQYEERCQQLVE